MTQLLVAVAVFLITHLVPGMPRLRGALVAGMGRRGYLVGYSALSLLVLAWVGHAYVQAPYVPLWDYEPRLAWVPAVVMYPAILLLVGGLASPNPLSMSLSRGRFDPARPGIASVVRHPVPWALALWAAAHMAANGDVAAWILFGLLLLLSIGGMAALDARKRRTLGEDEWRRLAARTSAWPFQAWLTGRARPYFAVTGRTVMVMVVGTALYKVVLMLHQPVIGVSPWPPMG